MKASLMANGSRANGSTANGSTATQGKYNKIQQLHTYMCNAVCMHLKHMKCHSGKFMKIGKMENY